MAEPDFDIEHLTREVGYTIGDRVRKTFYPTEGNNCAIVFIEATPANSAAVLAKLGEIQAISEDYKKLQWQAAALVGDYRPAVDVRAIVMNNAPLP